MISQRKIIKHLIDETINSISEKKQHEYGSNEYLKSVARRSGIKKGLIITEGGLKLDEPDRIKVTPSIAAEAIDIYENLIDMWNQYLVKNDSKEVKKIGPVGSTSYVSQDLEQGSNTSYGDIDYLVSFPVIVTTEKDFRKSERDSKKKYESLFVEFLKNSNFTNVDVEKTLKPGSSPMMVIVRIGDGSLVQVDTVITHPDYREWMKGRYTPERGIKGYTIGNLYKALGDHLVMSIGTDGVLVRIKQGERVPSKFSRSKGVETHRITTDIQNFLRDISEYLIDGEIRENPLLSSNPGIDHKNVKILGLARGIKGLALTLEDHGVYDAKEMIDAIKSYYATNMRNNVESKKKRGLDDESYDKLLRLNDKIIDLVDGEISL